MFFLAKAVLLLVYVMLGDLAQMRRERLKHRGCGTTRTIDKLGAFMSSAVFGKNCSSTETLDSEASGIEASPGAVESQPRHL